MKEQTQPAEPKEKAGNVSGFVETAFTEEEVDAASKFEMERGSNEENCAFLGTLPGAGH